MALLLKELSSLEVEPLEMTVNAPKPERTLDTLVESELAALLSNANFTASDDGGGNDPCCCVALCFCDVFCSN
jgi:hypothetical protein